MRNFERFAIVGLTAQWLVINVLWAQGREYLNYLYHMATFQFQTTDYTNIFPFTYVSALALFLFALYSFRVRLGLDWLKTVLFSISLPLAATSLFEEIYQDVGVYFHTPFITPPFEAHLINLSSIAFGMISLGYWRITRGFIGVSASYVFLWSLWIFSGYPQVYDPSVATLALIINVPLKVLTFALFAILVAGRAFQERDHDLGKKHLEQTVTDDQRK